jgi:membrane protease YdiL (CAAX protease family)
MRGRKKQTLMQASEHATSADVGANCDSHDRANSLTPILIVIYLSAFWIWICARPRDWLFTEELFNCAFLLSVALVLWRCGQTQDIRKYFVGRWLPGGSDVAKAGLVMAVAGIQVVLSNLLYWHWVGATPRPEGNSMLIRWLVTWPITEELVCRGVFLSILLRFTQPGRWGALFLSALLFTSLHCEPSVYYVLYIFGGGLVLGYGYIVTKSVPFCILCHSMCNGILWALANANG